MALKFLYFYLDQFITLDLILLKAKIRGGLIVRTYDCGIIIFVYLYFNETSTN